eukprot:6270826-Prorocentrum_lima.AAC.1
MSLTKAWWMKNFLHLQGTTLKAGQKSESKDPKKKAIQHNAKGISGMHMEVHAIPEEDWSQCTREQVLNQLEALSRK